MEDAKRNMLFIANNYIRHKFFGLKNNWIKKQLFRNKNSRLFSILKFM